MYSYTKIISQTFLIGIFFLSCENDPVNVTSEYIQSNVEVYSFDFSNSKSCNFQSNTFIDCDIENLSNIDSLNIVNSFRIYSGSPNDYNDQLYSYAVFNLDLSSTNDLSCTSDNFSSASMEITSFNQLKDEEFNDETEIDEVLEYYIDQSGIDIYLGHLNIDWSNLSNLPLDEFISSNDFETNMSNVSFSLGEYDVTIDSLENYVDNFCNLGSLDILIRYENNSDDDMIKDYIEFVSSDYIFQPSQPKLYIDYELTEQETVVENKFIFDSVFENNQSLSFNLSFEDDLESNDWGKFLIANSEDLESTSLSNLSIDSIVIDSPLISTISNSFFDFDLSFTFSINNSDINVDNFLPIEFYIDNLVGYVESSDPIGDNWQDCGSDSDCSFVDVDGSQNNGIWDIGERYEKNQILDWNDENGNNEYDFGETLIESFNDYGVDNCPNIYEMGVGEDCATEPGQSLYNDLGTQNNNIYDYNESFEDVGDDGCLDIYEDGLGGCSLDNSNYDIEENPDPNGDNYNIDPNEDNWKDYGSDGCFDEFETGDPDNPCDSNNSSYDEELNSDPNGDNYSFSDNLSGTELNGVWDIGELSEGNGRYDLGETFYDVGSNGLMDSIEEFPDIDNYDELTNPLGTEGNGQWDLGEPYQDYGVDGVINYLEPNYNTSGTENNNLYDTNEPFEDLGLDGCEDIYETGNLDNPCDLDDPAYDQELNPDPNQDNYFVDINSDDWQDCGSDSDCSFVDEDGTHGNGVWDIGEGTELNGKIDWIDTNLNNRIDIDDCINESNECEIWFDDGQDLKPDSLEYLDAGSFLSNNIVHNAGLSANFYLDQNFSYEVEELIDNSKDLNIWFSSIGQSSNPDIYEAIISMRLRKPTKAIEFKVSHSPNIYLDSIDNSYTSIFYGGSDSLINDISVYNIAELNSLHSSSNITLSYGQGIKSHLDFEGLSEFINGDSSIFIDKNNSSLILYPNYIDDEYYFDSGFADVYFSDQNIFLKRIYFDNMDSVSIPIGDLMQKFIDKEFEYNGINLEIDGNGYNFNHPIFYNYNQNENSIFNPKLNLMYAK